MSAHVGDAPLTFDNLVITEIYVQAADESTGASLHGAIGIDDDVFRAGRRE
jgi:hypothetical protein